MMDELEETLMDERGFYYEPRMRGGGMSSLLHELTKDHPAPTAHAPIKLFNGDEIIQVRCNKRVDAYALERMVAVGNTIDSIKERMIHDLLRELVNALDESGAIQLDIQQVDMREVEFMLSLRVVKDGNRI